ncbi:MAG: DUF2200 family protein [Candidatus Ornithospirochaeta sp.]
MPKKDVFSLPFATVYKLLVNKVEKKGRGKEDVDKVISWLFGYKEDEINDMANGTVSYGFFISSAPFPNPKRFEKKGRVCGIKVEEIQEERERDMRILDLMVDEIAKGKTQERVLMEE